MLEVSPRPGFLRDKEEELETSTDDHVSVLTVNE